jgi:hypothetical protein
MIRQHEADDSLMGAKVEYKGARTEPTALQKFDFQLIWPVVIVPASRESIR